MTATADGGAGRYGPLWFGLLAGPIGWSIQLLANYFLVSIGCRDGYGWAPLAVHLVSLLVLLLALAGLRTAHGLWRASGVDGEADVGAPRGRVGFMGLTGVLSSGFFVLVIAVSAIPPFFVAPC